MQGSGSVTLKKEMGRHQIAFASEDSQESVVRLGIFYTCLSESLRRFCIHFSITFLNLGNVFLIGKTKEHSWLFLMFQLIKKDIFTNQEVIQGSIDQEL